MSGTYFDHFEAGSLPSQWSAVLSGEGVQSMSDSGVLLGFTSGATNDSAAIVRAFDRSLGTYHRMAWCYSALITAPVFRPKARLLSNSGTPAADTNANLNAKTLLFFYQNDVAGTRCGQLAYRNTSNAQQDWTESSQTFTAANQNSTPTITNPDYHITGFDWDEANSRVRMFWYHCASGSSFVTDSGPKLMALTDWVSFASIQLSGSSTLWLALGFLENNLVSFGTTEGLHIEWFCHEWSDSLGHLWANQKDVSAGTYDIKHWQFLNGTDRRIILPESRTGLTIAKGSPAWKSNSTQHGSAIRGSNGTYYKSFSGNSGGSNSIGIASSATGMDGSWTEYASNPVIAPSAGTDRGAIGQNVTLEDLTEPDVNKRWKCIVTQQSDLDSKIRVFLYYASTPFTTSWTYDGVLIDYNATDGATGVQLYCNPVYKNNKWYLFYVGIDPTNLWQNFVATGDTLRAGAFTKDRTTNFIPAGLEMTVSTGSSTSRTVTVNDTTGVVQDMFLMYDNDSNGSNWCVTRVRKVISSTQLELYHLVPGMASSGVLRSITRGKNYFHWIEPVGNQWLFYGTAFGVMYQHATFNSNEEGACLWTSPDLLGGARSVDWQRTPGVHLARNGNSSSSENLRGLQSPYANEVPTRILARRNSTLIRR